VSPLDHSLLYSQTDAKSSEIMLAEFGGPSNLSAAPRP